MHSLRGIRYSQHLLYMLVGTMQGRTQGGRQGDVSPPFDVGGSFCGFFLYTRCFAVTKLLIAKCATNGSRAIELLLSKLNCIMLLLRLHDVTILREVAFRSIIHKSESKNKWRKLAYVKRVEATTSPCRSNASEKTKLFAKSCHSGDAILPGTTAQNSSSTRSTVQYVSNVQDASAFVQ